MSSEGTTRATHKDKCPDKFIAAVRRSKVISRCSCCFKSLDWDQLVLCDRDANPIVLCAICKESQAKKL